MLLTIYEQIPSSRSLNNLYLASLLITYTDIRWKGLIKALHAD